MNESQSDVSAYVAAEVRAELARRKMTVSEAAERLGWKMTSAHRRITGQSPMDVGHIQQIAEILDIDVQEFFPVRTRSGRGFRTGPFPGLLLAA